MTEPVALAGSAVAAPIAPRPATGQYTLRYAGVRSGAVYGPLPVTSASGSTGQRGDASADLQVPPGTGLYRSLPPGRTMWVVEWNQGPFQRVVAAGVVWQREASTAGIKLGGGGLFSILARRALVPPVAAQDVPLSDVSFTGLDYGSIMRGIVAYIVDMPEGDLPVTLQEPRAGSRSATYPGYSLPKAGAAILDLADIEPNTDFLLAPRFANPEATAITWDLLTGTEQQPQLVNTVPHELDGTASRQKVISDVKVGDSAVDLNTTAWAKDSGVERSAIIRATSDFTLTGSGYPRLDGDTTASTGDGDEVQGWANGLLARTFRPARGVTVSVSAEKWWPLNARIGDLVHVRYRHPELGLIDLTSRVLNEAWDVKSQWVDLTLADTLAEDGV